MHAVISLLILTLLHTSVMIVYYLLFACEPFLLRLWLCLHLSIVHLICRCLEYTQQPSPSAVYDPSVIVIKKGKDNSSNIKMKIGRVQKYQYLGTIIDSDNDQSIEINRRIEMVRSTFYNES